MLDVPATVDNAYDGQLPGTCTYVTGSCHEEVPNAGFRGRRAAEYHWMKLGAYVCAIWNGMGLGSMALSGPVMRRP